MWLLVLLLGLPSEPETFDDAAAMVACNALADAHSAYWHETPLDAHGNRWCVTDTPDVDHAHTMWLLWTR